MSRILDKIVSKNDELRRTALGKIKNAGDKVANYDLSRMDGGTVSKLGKKIGVSDDISHTIGKGVQKVSYAARDFADNHGTAAAVGTAAAAGLSAAHLAKKAKQKFKSRGVK